jgi:serine protease AprX
VSVVKRECTETCRQEGIEIILRRSNLFRYAVAAVAAVAVALLAFFAASGVSGAQQGASLDAELRSELSSLGSGEVTQAILTYENRPTGVQVEAVRAVGVDVHTFDALPMVAVQGTAAQIRQLATLGGVLGVYANEELEYFLDESVPLIGADRVHGELGVTGRGVGVAVIDSGIDGTHGDVRYPERTVQNVKILGDAIFGTGSVVVEDQPNTDLTSGHGTHVAGTIGGDGTESGGLYTGVAPESDLIGIGAGDVLFILYALEGFDYAIANQDRYNIRIISNSWGTSGEFDPNHPINVASREAYERGMTVVFAAGNSGPEEDTLNPYSVAPWVIGVAAGEKDGRTLADFSSRGRPGDDLYHPTLTAPGVSIVASRASTDPGGTRDATTIPPEHLPSYTNKSGTSMATPHVSGVAALMLETDPGLTPDQVKDILVQTATPMPYEEWEAGAGYLDAYGAVTAAGTQ